jgi:succinate--hydroxymethylglutarate CoA-transferase
MAALLQKFRSKDQNLGQKIDVSLLNCQVASLANIASNYLVAGKEASRLGTAHGSIVPYQAFQLQTKGEYFIIGAGNDAQFQKLCKVLGLDSLASDPRFKSNKDRVANRVSLVESLSLKFKSLSRQDCISLFKDSGIPHGPVNNISQTFSHPQLIHNNIVKRVTHPQLGDFDLVGNPLRFSAFEPDYSDCAPPLLGEHTSEVLKDMLGLDEDAIKNLSQSSVIQCQEK